jgi:hypothetical protein
LYFLLLLRQEKYLALVMVEKNWQSITHSLALTVNSQDPPQFLQSA